MGRQRRRRGSRRNWRPTVPRQLRGSLDSSRMDHIRRRRLVRLRHGNLRHHLRQRNQRLLHGRVRRHRRRGNELYRSLNRHPSRGRLVRLRDLHGDQLGLPEVLRGWQPDHELVRRDLRNVHDHGQRWIPHFRVDVLQGLQRQQQRRHSLDRRREPASIAGH